MQFAAEALVFPLGAKEEKRERELLRRSADRYGVGNDDST